MPATAGKVRPASPLKPGPVPPARGFAGGASELAALRQALLAPEQAVLKNIQHRLDDPATRARELADALPAAAGLAAADPAGSGDLAAALMPVVRAAVAEALRERPDLLARGCGRALRGAAVRPFRTAGRLIGGLFRRSPRGRARVEKLYLMRVSDGALLGQVARPPGPEVDPLDPAWQAEERAAVSMATYFLTCLRDPAALAHYALLKHLRVGRHTFAVHADDRHVLLSVIAAPPGLIPAEALMWGDGVLAAMPDPPALPALDGESA
jgi:hypothetical protein